MKTNSYEDETQNLVMFPSSKNFKIDLSGMEFGNDPVNDLLNEFSHIGEDQLPLEEHFELNFEDELDGDTFHSLEAFMNRHQRGESLSPDDRLINMINDRLDAIKEAKERIKFYLDEIDMFLPSRRK
ncbi:MAG: hypothetical protein WC635_14725 [Bacteriovorax sp.]|jgi:hypothetical protein